VRADQEELSQQVDQRAAVPQGLEAEVGWVARLEQVAANSAAQLWQAARLERAALPADSAAQLRQAARLGQAAAQPGWVAAAADSAA
jgi:hypothetical protein